MTADDYRSQYPVLERWVFFNHAAVAPLCRPALERIRAWADDAARSGDVHEADWIREIEQRRAQAAHLLAARPDEIAFVKNTSEGLGVVAEGFPWREGDNVVVAEGEYPANVYPWMNLASRGVELRTVPLRNLRVEPDDLERAMDARTRLLSISFVQFSSGFRSDLARLGELCNKRGVDFCVDAIQGLGVFPIDVDAMRIDYLAADGHKWLTGPEGAGLFYVRRELLDKIRPVSVGWKSVVRETDFSNIDFRLKPSAARFEEGSFNTAGLLALGACIDFFLSVGIENVRDRVKAATDEVIDRVRAIGGEVASPRGPTEWSGIVSFSLPGRDPLQTVRSARRRGVALSARSGRLRASPHFYNNADDVQRMIEAILEG